MTAGQHYFPKGTTQCQYCGKHQLEVLGRPNLCHKAPPVPACRVSGVVPVSGAKTGRFEAKAVDVLVQSSDPSLVEQLARQLETYASDQEALLRRGARSIEEGRRMVLRADIYKDSAKSLRETMTAQNKALYQVDIIKLLDDVYGADNRHDETALKLVNMFMEPAK